MILATWREYAVKYLEEESRFNLAFTINIFITLVDEDRHGEASAFYARNDRPENEQLAEHLDVQDQGFNRVVHITPYFQKKSLGTKIQSFDSD